MQASQFPKAVECACRIQFPMIHFSMKKSLTSAHPRGSMILSKVPSNLCLIKLDGFTLGLHLACFEGILASIKITLMECAKRTMILVFALGMCPQLQGLKISF